MKDIKNIWLYSVMILLSLPFTGLTAQTDTVCFNDTILYEIPGAKNETYSWTISGGSILYSSIQGDSVIAVWNESPGLHTVEVTMHTENYCSSDPKIMEVFVYQPAIDLGSDMVICEGSTELLVLESGYREYLWNGHPGTNEFVLSSEGIVKLEVKDKYGCWSGDSIIVTEHKTPDPEFKVSVDTLNRTVSLKNTSDSLWQFYWNFGDTGYSDEYEPGTHTYAGPGTYEINLVASHQGCSGSSSQVVRIADPLEAGFETVFAGCAPVEITFINQSKGADNYYWDFGNGNYSTAEEPVTLYEEAGIYEVTLIAFKDTVHRISKKSIIVNKAPMAAFTIDQSEMTNKEISFINESANAIKYYWDFGDGDTSDLYEPNHLYLLQGDYDVSLSVWSEAGCFDSVLISNAVTIIPDCRMLFPSGFIPNKDGPSGGYYNPDQTTDDNEIFHPLYSDIDTYELRIYNRWGELVFMSRDIDIGWDGYYKGKLAPQDTYVYEAKATCPSGEGLSAVGSVTLIH